MSFAFSTCRIVVLFSAFSGIVFGSAVKRDFGQTNGICSLCFSPFDIKRILYLELNE